MNLILLDENDLIDKKNAELSCERFEYIRKIHRAKEGDFLKAGMINGKIGSAKVKKIDNKSVVLLLDLDKSPPPPLDIKLVLSLPRPKVLRRIVQSITTIGIKDIYIINSFRVEKSYWQTPFLKEEKIDEQIRLGLSQSVDTIPPRFNLRKLFKPFVEDELNDISKGTEKVVAHPGGGKYTKSESKGITVAIGPEGGFIDYELKKLEEIGFKRFEAGKRILKVETAIPFVLSKISRSPV